VAPRTVDDRDATVRSRRRAGSVPSDQELHFVFEDRAEITLDTAFVLARIVRILSRHLESEAA
jgi:hypothetical protein